MKECSLFSIIIPTYQRNDLLAKCLDRLAPGVQTLSADQYEVIVSDDGRETTAESMIKEQYDWVKWLKGPQKGPAANRNNGAKYAQGEWLVFTDDDCLPDPQWLEAYSKAIVKQPDCLVFEGRTYVDQPKSSLADTAPLNETGGYLWSCNFAMEKQLFESLGGFDERFPYAAMEDVELRLRLTKLEYRFDFVPLASVLHPWRNQGSWKKLKQHGESVLIYLSIHPDQKSQINFKSYMWMFFYSLIKVTLPGIIKYRMRGIREDFMRYIAILRMAFILYNS
jgi:GT2 family glycosyltransferase